MTTLVRATIWAILASLSFQISNALVKAVGTALPSPEVALFRAAGGVLLVLVAWRELSALRRLSDPWMHAVRGGLGVLTLLCLMHAFSTLPLALVTAVYYGRVLLMIPLASVTLGERSRPALWLAAAMGFAGVAVAVLPSLQEPELGSGVIALLIATAASAGSQVAVTRLTRSNPPSVIVAVFCAVSMLALTPATAAVWTPPSFAEAALLVGIGLAGAGAQYAVTRAYALAGASYVAPFSYLEIPVAAVIGFAMAGEVPTVQQAVGCLLVVAATVFVTSATAPRPRRAVQVA